MGREGAYWWAGIRTDRSGEDDLAGRDTRWLPGPGVILRLKILQDNFLKCTLPLEISESWLYYEIPTFKN